MRLSVSCLSRMYCGCEIGPGCYWSLIGSRILPFTWDENHLLAFRHSSTVGPPKQQLGFLFDLAMRLCTAAGSTQEFAAGPQASLCDGTRVASSSSGVQRVIQRYRRRWRFGVAVRFLDIIRRHKRRRRRRWGGGGQFSTSHRRPCLRCWRYNIALPWRRFVPHARCSTAFQRGHGDGHSVPGPRRSDLLLLLLVRPSTQDQQAAGRRQRPAFGCGRVVAAWHDCTPENIVDVDAARKETVRSNRR